MLAGLGRRNGVSRVVLRITANGNHVEVWRGQHFGQIVVISDPAAVPGIGLRSATARGSMVAPREMTESWPVGRFTLKIWRP